MINIREDFKFLNKKDVVYLDSSSTSLKPNFVIDEINNYYENFPLNYGRGNSKYTLKINKKIAETREIIKEFINATSIDEIIFTSGATESSNLLAYSYGLLNLNDNDEILLCQEDHKSTVLPWKNIKNILEKRNVDIKLKEILIDYEGDYKEEDLLNKVNEKTKVVVLTHIHNMYGLEMDINKIVPLVKEKNKDCKIILDASQSIGHIKVDVQELNVDFMYFSGHKMFALQGSGVLYVKKENYKLLNPFIVGGGNNNEEKDISNYSVFESGTPNIPGIISLGSAIKYINVIGINKIEEYIYMLTRYLYEELLKIKEVDFNKGIDKCKCAIGYGILSFKIKAISTSDISEIMDEYGVIIREGNFCNASNNDNYIRVSLHVYNTKEDIDKFIKVIKYIIKES